MPKKIALPLILLMAVANLASGNTKPSGIPAVLTGSNPNGASNDVAYNDKSRVYLQVWGHPVVYGAFVNEAGTPVGGAFVISNQSAVGGGSDALPRVIYSQGSADDVFVVSFTSEFNRGQYLYLRTVRYTPNGPSLGPIQLVSGAGAEINRKSGLAFNPFKRQVFLVWETPSLGWEVFGQLWQLSGAPESPSAAPATSVLNISESPNAQGEPNVAFDWKHDKYLVAYRGESPASDLIKGSWARVVTFDGANAVGKSGVITLSAGNGEPAEQNVVYMPEADGFFAFWTDITRVRDLSGRVLTHDGVPTTGILPVLATSSNEGAADAEYSPYTRTILLGAMRDWSEGFVQGVELTAGGAAFNWFQASTAQVDPAKGLESLYPRVTVGHGGRFGLSYVNNYMNVWFELLQGQTQLGGEFPTPPPPPPPACSVSVSPTAITAAGPGGTAGVTVSGTCNWTATSGSPWITVTGGASGTGAGTVTLSFAANSTGAQRAGAVTIAGQSIAVIQPAFTLRAGVHDISGDGMSDVMWHNRATGHIAVWNLSGPNVTATYYINGGPVDTNWKVVGTGDLNGDGYADLVWRHTNGRVAGWLLQGPNVIAAQGLVNVTGPAPVAAVEPDAAWEIRAVGDLSGDGKADLVWQHATTGALAAWFMDGFNLVRAAALSVGAMPDLNWKIAGAGDINSDGKADLIWQHDGNGALGAWLMFGEQVVMQRRLTAYVADLSWKVRGVGDVNGDGMADILWQNTGTGGLGVWYLNQFSVTLTYSLSIRSVADPTNWTMVGPG
jgi:hypothetical protein